MKFWCQIGNDITADMVWEYTYYCAANGLIAAGADPDGTAMARKGHAFKALASFTNMNWALFQYKGSEAFDNSA